MTGLLVTVDLGNSRCKLRSWPCPAGTGRTGRGRMAAEDSEDLGGDPASIVDGATAWLHGVSSTGEIRGVALASVASPELEGVVGGLLRGHSSRVLVNPTSGVENRCQEPETVGQDRLFAARGAVELLGRSCLVVDAGTALTVDLVLVGDDGGEPSGALLGGAIAPGPALLARALASWTANLPLVEPRTGAPALGRRTESAIAAGIAVGFRGAARELVARLADEAALGELPVVLTGGASDFLSEPEVLFAREVMVSRDLVHRGLLAVLAAAPIPARPDS